MPEQSLQEKYAPGNACFGCGPANPDGLHIRSFPEGDQVVAEWKRKPGKPFRCAKWGNHRRFAGLPLQLDGSVSSDETDEQRPAAVHGTASMR
jgi:hypothetical protein